MHGVDESICQTQLRCRMEMNLRLFQNEWMRIHGGGERVCAYTIAIRNEFAVP